MKPLTIIVLLATAATAQQSSLNRWTQSSGSSDYSSSAVLNPPPSPPWVQLYEVPLDWNGCTISLHMDGAKRQCFMSVRDIIAVRDNAEELQIVVSFSGDIPAALMSSDAASWMYYVMRMMYPSIGQSERKQP